MNIVKIDSKTVSMANILMYAEHEHIVEFSRPHVGPTTASLPHLHTSQGTTIITQIVDTTFGDNIFVPHRSVSMKGTKDVADPAVITYLSKATSSDKGLLVGDSIADWHIDKLTQVFPTTKLDRLSRLIATHAEMIIQLIQAAWDIISTSEHRFRHYIESNGVVTNKEATSQHEVLEDLAGITSPTGWKIPNVLIITLDILRGSKKGRNYYHLCGSSMWKYIDHHGYYETIAAILEKMQRFGRQMYLVNTSAFKAFSLKEDQPNLDRLWSLWNQWKQESLPKKTSQIEQEIIKQVRSKKLPWYDGCSAEYEITQHDLQNADELYVPTWALHTNFATLAEFVDQTMKYWKTKKK